MKPFFLILTLLLGYIKGTSQVAVSSGSYFQDFGTTDITSWTNNVTYTGWYEVGTFQSHINITAAAPSNTGGFYTYECNGNNDQKIGSRASGGSGTLMYGVVLQNTTGSAISNVRVAYKGYQLSLAQNGAINTINFDYIVSTIPPSISASGGVSVPALNFTQLQNNATSGSSQVLGYPCTQVTNLSNCITVSIPNNSYILLRWKDIDDAGNDHHMAIDDVDVQFLASTPAVNSSTICASQTTTLIATGATNYTWSPGTGLSVTTGSVVIANPTLTTVYTVSASVSSCPLKTITSTVTINPGVAISVNSSTICATGAATLTASGATNYTWSPSTGLSASTGNNVIATPGNTMVYTVIGFSGACGVTPANATVSVIPSPTLTVNSQSICSSGVATLTANGASAYSWTPSTSLSSTTGSMVTANPSVTTIYTLNGNNGLCAALPVTSTVTVIVTPVLSVNSQTICGGGSASLTASGATSYTWSPNTTLSSTNGNTVTANPVVNTVYTVTGSNGQCMGVPATSTVAIITTPTVSVNSENICASGEATLTATGATSYTWSPSTALNTSTGNSVISTPTTNMTYTVTGFTGLCSSNAISVVIIAPLQSADFKYASSGFCQTATNPLPLVTGVLGGIFTALPSNLQIHPSTGLINLVSSAPGIYTVNYQTSGTCPDTKTFSLSIHTVPSLTIDPVSVCKGDTATITAIPSLTGGSYIWQPGSLTVPYLLVSPSSNTTYTLTYLLAGCSVTHTTNVLVNTLPIAAIATAPSTGNEEISFTASGGINYLWSNGSNTQVITVRANESVNYCVTVTDSQGCKDTACASVITDNQSTLYIPNVFTPNADGLNDFFKIPYTNIVEFDITIFNRWGESLFKSNNIELSWDGAYNGKTVEDGVYVYIITATGKDKVPFDKKGHITVLK